MVPCHIKNSLFAMRHAHQARHASARRPAMDGRVSSKARTAPKDKSHLPATVLAGFVSGSAKLTPGTLPEEIVVVPWGTTQTRRGPVICDERTLAAFDAFQARERRDHVMGDFNHNTMPGRAAQPTLKACKASAQCVRGVGIVVKPSYWTPEGQTHVAGGHYPDVSPCFDRADNGVIYGLHSFAFCEHGEMQAGELELFSADGAPPTPSKPNQSMDPKKLLLTLLGLPPEATDEEIAAAVAAKEPEGMSTGTLRQGTALRPQQPDPAIAELRTLVTGMRAELAESKVDGLIAAATSAGKEIKLDRATLVGMGAEVAGKYLDTLTAGTVTVSGAEQGNANNAGATGGTENKTNLHGFSAEEAKVITDSGITLEAAAKARDAK